jgi:hypothetical protein
MLLEHLDTPEMKDTTIVIGTPVRWAMEQIRARQKGRKIIVYNLEQMVSNETWHNNEKLISNMKGADEIWDFDPLNVAFFQNSGVKVDRVFDFKYTNKCDRGIGNIHPINLDIDVLFYGFMNMSRAKLLGQIQFNLYPHTTKIVTLFGYLGAGLDNYLKRTKIVLNIHAFQPFNRQECPRIFYLLCNGMCVLSEQSQYNHFPGMIVESKADELSNSILDLLKDYKYKEVGKLGREKFKNGN